MDGTPQEVMPYPNTYLNIEIYY